MKSMLKRLIILALPIIMFYGCAAPPLPDLVWPEPPDEPRIKYVRDYRGSSDFRKSTLAADIVLGAEGGSSIKKPLGVHVDNRGRVYVTDTAASDIHVMDPANKVYETLSGKGTKVFFKPIGVSSDSTGRLFISDSQTDKVAVLEPDGKLKSFLEPDEPFKQPSGMAVDNDRKRLYVTDTHNHNIYVFDLDTLKQVRTIGKRGKEEGEFNFPSNIAVDRRGNLYVVDTMNGRVQIFDSDGKFIRAFGQFGDAPGMFARPKGIAIDSEDHIYIVDAAFNNVQIFNDEGQILLSFAGYGEDRGQMILPAGISIDNEDYIYVVDSWNARVNVYEYLGEKSKARVSAPKKQ